MLGTPKSVIWLPEVSWASREIATRDSLAKLANDAGRVEGATPYELCMINLYLSVLVRMGTEGRTRSI